RRSSRGGGHRQRRERPRSARPIGRCEDHRHGPHPSRGGFGRHARSPSSFCDSSRRLDRNSTRLNSSHRCISYAVFCLKKKKKIKSAVRIKKKKKKQKEKRKNNKNK